MCSLPSSSDRTRSISDKTLFYIHVYLTNEIGVLKILFVPIFRTYNNNVVRRLPTYVPVSFESFYNYTRVYKCTKRIIFEIPGVESEQHDSFTVRTLQNYLKKK